MGTLWFVLAAAMVATYVVLDGFDLGAGIVHLLVARTEEERDLVLRSIGPVWDGNEVWLLAAGGVLVLAFPSVYATAFSGFYLPLMIVLWLLIGRACAVELRHQVHHPVWAPFWDAIFAVSSGLLALGFGAALGNVVRGVPLDSADAFFEPLWSDFQAAGRTGILDWYTVLVGVAAVVTLAMHGALWVAVKLEGPPQARARAVARLAAMGAVATAVVVTAATFRVQPHVPARFAAHPWLYVFPALAVAGLLGVFRGLRQGHDARAFAGSCAHVVGMLTSAAFGLYPFLLPGTRDENPGLTVDRAAASERALATGLVWWVPGILLAAGYQIWAYRHFQGKVRPDGGGY